MLVVRHGRTLYNQQRRFLGRTDLPLDSVGRAQATAWRPWRGAFACVVSSPLKRATMTAASLADRLEIDEAFAELDQGDLEGQLVAEAMRTYPSFFEAWAEDPGAVRVPGGGRMDELRDHALAALHRWARCHRGQAIAVVSHQLVLASLLATIEDAPLSDWRRFALPNAGGALLAYDGERFTVAQRPLAPPDSAL